MRKLTLSEALALIYMFDRFPLGLAEADIQLYREASDLIEQAGREAREARRKEDG